MTNIDSYCHACGEVCEFTIDDIDGPFCGPARVPRWVNVPGRGYLYTADEAKGWVVHARHGGTGHDGHYKLIVVPREIAENARKCGK